MSYVAAKDISHWQGNWQETGEPIVMIKCGGGDNNLYFDPKCAANYKGATADGRAVGLYWFIGWLAGAEQEAAFMLWAVSPLAENDVYALDIEKGAVAVPANAVQYVTDMANYIHDHTGAWPLLYMSLSTLNAFDWSGVLKNCGLWLADWSVSPDATIPTHYRYVMQQYNDGPIYDHDAWFGTIEEFKAYGYHAPQPTPAPQPVQPPQPTNTPDPTPPTPAPQPPTPISGDGSTPVSTPPEPVQSDPAPQQTPAPVQEAAAPKTTVVSVSRPSLWVSFWLAIFKIFGGK